MHGKRLVRLQDRVAFPRDLIMREYGAEPRIRTEFPLTLQRQLHLTHRAPSTFGGTDY